MPPRFVDSLLEVTPYGLHAPTAGLHLDAAWAPGAVFVSHAHADHCSRADRIVCTPETAALHQQRRGHRDTLLVPFDTPTTISDAEVVLHSAGHCLGAAMIEVRSAAGVLVYTGDFKLRANPFTPPTRIPRCDALVMECTFGDPRYAFPPDDALLARLFEFVDAALRIGATPVILAYALGKAQEALFHLTRRGYDVAVHGAIARLCRVHVESGQAFPGPGIWTPYRRGAVGHRVLLTTPATRRAAMVQGLAKTRVAYLTGWAKHPGAHNIYRGCDLVLPFSDHADYDELVRTARESGASRIYTVHGPREFARRLTALGMNAQHLATHPQDLCDDEAMPAAAGAVIGPGPAAQERLELP